MMDIGPCSDNTQTMDCAVIPEFLWQTIPSSASAHAIDDCVQNPVETNSRATTRLHHEGASGLGLIPDPHDPVETDALSGCTSAIVLRGG